MKFHELSWYNKGIGMLPTTFLGSEIVETFEMLACPQ